MNDARKREDHDRGLAADLERIARERRRALTLLLAGGAGAAGLLPRLALAAEACEPAKRGTAGPFPANGTNGRGGTAIDVLRETGIVRSDIRASFGHSRTVAPGLPLELTLTLVDSRRGCAPLAGHALYLWQADRRGEYSLYQGEARRENYLRGVQLTDEHGRARFTTLYPPCYDGRYPHIHFEVYAAAPSATNRLRTSQLAMPAEESRAVYAAAEGYGRSGDNFAPMRPGTDGVFRGHTPAQLAAITPRLQGDPRRGFSGTVTLAL